VTRRRWLWAAVVLPIVVGGALLAAPAPAPPPEVLWSTTWGKYFGMPRPLRLALAPAGESIRGDYRLSLVQSDLATFGLRRAPSGWRRVLERCGVAASDEGDLWIYERDPDVTREVGGEPWFRFVRRPASSPDG
jgi:hypothetical protein